MRICRRLGNQEGAARLGYIRTMFSTKNTRTSRQRGSPGLVMLSDSCRVSPTNNIPHNLNHLDYVHRVKNPIVHGTKRPIQQAILTSAIQIQLFL